jgi:hypothetical protein
MNAFERFIAGQDRLGALLKNLPRYEAPERLIDAIQTQAETLEQQKRAFAENRVFAPPASLQEAVLREAQTLHAAQSARRRAVLRQVAREEDLTSLFGGPLDEKTQVWLRQEARAETPPPAWQFWRQWNINTAGRRRLAFGWAFSLAMLCGLMLHYYLPPSAPLPSADTAKTPAPPVLREPAPPVYAQADISKATEPVMQESAEPESPQAYARADLPAAAESTNKKQRRAALALRPPPASAPDALEAKESLPPQPAAVAAAPLPAPLSSESRSAKMEAPANRAPSAAVAPPPAAKPMSDARMSDTLSQLSQKTAAPVVSFLYPADAAQWKTLAETLKANDHNNAPATWRLFAADPENAKVQALAAYLKKTLPNGQTLRLHTDSSLAAPDARLEKASPPVASPNAEEHPDK